MSESEESKGPKSKKSKPKPTEYELNYPMDMTRKECAFFEEETGVSHTVIPMHLLDINKPSAHIENVLTLIALQRESPNYTMDNVLEGSWVLNLDPLIAPVKEKLKEAIDRTKRVNAGEVKPKEGELMVPKGMMSTLEPELD